MVLEGSGATSSPVGWINSDVNLLVKLLATFKRRAFNWKLKMQWYNW